MMGWDDAIAEALKVANKFITDPQEQAKLQIELEKIRSERETQLAVGQMEVNKVEAASEDRFTSRWRPFIGWTCGVALAYHFIAQPLLAFLFAASGHPITLPLFDMDTLNTILMGLLGLGGMRSLEKIKLR